MSELLLSHKQTTRNPTPAQLSPPKNSILDDITLGSDRDKSKIPQLCSGLLQPINRTFSSYNGTGC